MIQVKQSPYSEPHTAFRILIVDSDKMDEIQQACLSKGYEVVLVHNKEEAVKFLRSSDHVDAAIASAFMENESIFDFLLAMRKMPQNEKAPMIVFSAEPGPTATFCEPVVEAAARLLGAYKFLTMPTFDVHQVMRELDAVLPEVPAKVSKG